MLSFVLGSLLFMLCLCPVNVLSANLMCKFLSLTRECSISGLFLCPVSVVFVSILNTRRRRRRRKRKRTRKTRRRRKRRGRRRGRRRKRRGRRSASIKVESGWERRAYPLLIERPDDKVNCIILMYVISFDE